jgi:hypothetical protein
MVYLDALVEAPTYAITLTTRHPVWDGERYREGKAQLMRRLRAEFGRVEALEFIEQTTGKAPRSGGRRRGHGHNLIKGIPLGCTLELDGSRLKSGPACSVRGTSTSPSSGAREGRSPSSHSISRSKRERPAKPRQTCRRARGPFGQRAATGLGP